jgi:pimeloyl-ACP methyl ester carboxylesterase
MAYVRIDNLDFYYEVHGTRDSAPPLVLLHGGDPTIETSFAHLLPELMKHRQVIAFEQAGHGRTADRPDAPFSFEQSADDAAALMKALGIALADFFGYSNGGTIALQIAIRHPGVARKLIIMSANYRCDGMYPWFWDSMKSATLASMPADFQEAYRRTSPHPERLQSYFEKSTTRMLDFKDIPDAALKAIHSPALIVVGDRDVVTPEHGAAMQRLIPNARLAILPNTDHMQMVERTTTLVPMIEAFLGAK